MPGNPNQVPKLVFNRENTKKSAKIGLLGHNYGLRGIPNHAKFFKYFDYQKYCNFAIFKVLPKIIKNPNLLIPHAKYQTIYDIPYKFLAKKGFKAVVFDKDNTLTLPHKYTIDNSSLFGELQKQIGFHFPKNSVAVISNTYCNLRYNFEEEYEVADLMFHVPNDWVGLELHEKMELTEKRDEIRKEWRKNISKSGRKIRMLQNVPAVIHSRPKPDCGQDIIDHFCDVSSHPITRGCEIVLVGDRILTDIVMGNMHGMYTIQVDPLDHTADDFAVRLGRTFEVILYRVLVGYHQFKNKRKEGLFGRLKRFFSGQENAKAYYNQLNYNKNNNQSEQPKNQSPDVSGEQTPKTEAAKTEAVKTETPKTEAPQSESVKTEAPKTETPKTEAVKTEAPKTEAPQSEAVKTETPKTEAPKSEAVKTEAPKSEADQQVQEEAKKDIKQEEIEKEKTKP